MICYSLKNMINRHEVPLCSALKLHIYMYRSTKFTCDGDLIFIPREKTEILKIVRTYHNLTGCDKPKDSRNEIYSKKMLTFG